MDLLSLCDTFLIQSLSCSEDVYLSSSRSALARLFYLRTHSVNQQAVEQVLERESQNRLVLRTSNHIEAFFLTESARGLQRARLATPEDVFLLGESAAPILAHRLIALGGTPSCGTGVVRDNNCFTELRNRITELTSLYKAYRQEGYFEHEALLFSIRQIESDIHIDSKLNRLRQCWKDSLKGKRTKQRLESEDLLLDAIVSAIKKNTKKMDSRLAQEHLETLILMLLAPIKKRA